jgi:hypothetical protein
MSKKTVEGSSICVVSDESDELRGSIKNTNTATIAGALTSGAEFHGRGYIDAVEEVDGQPKRRTTWVLDAAKKLEFLPNFEAEQITVAEFVRRFRSREWCLAHPDHPIAYMHFYADNAHRLIDRVKTRKPGKLIRNGRGFVILDDGCPPEKAAKFMEDLRNGI